MWQSVTPRARASGDEAVGSVGAGGAIRLSVMKLPVGNQQPMWTEFTSRLSIRHPRLLPEEDCFPKYPLRIGSGPLIRCPRPLGGLHPPPQSQVARSLLGSNCEPAWGEVVSRAWLIRAVGASMRSGERCTSAKRGKWDRLLVGRGDGLSQAARSGIGRLTVIWSRANGLDYWWHCVPSLVSRLRPRGGRR
jgi:hypothetical protein